MSKATPKDHLIILHEFLMGNKAHTTFYTSVSKLLESTSKLLTSEYKVISDLHHSYFNTVDIPDILLLICLS